MSLARRGARAMLCALALAAGVAAQPGHAAEDDDTIAALVLRIERLEARIRALEAGSESDPQGIAGAAATPPDAPAPAVADRRLEPDPREQERLVRAAFQRRLLERGGLLLPPGTLDLDLSLRYLNSSSDRIVIDGFTILPVLVVGDIVSERVSHDFAEVSVTARLGLPWDMQASVRVPAAYQQRRIVTAENEERSAYDFGLGDVEVELSHQLYRSRGAWPDLLGSLRWKTDTGSNPLNAAAGDLTLGSGYQSLGASLTTVTVADPAVFFGGLSYTHNFATNSDLGRYEPGYSYGFDVGIALALNLGSSLSFAYDHQFTEPSALNGVTVPGSRLSTGVLSIGASYGATPMRTLDFSVGIGITEDSPDLLISTTFPLRPRY